MSGSPSKYRGGKIPIPSGFQPRSSGVKKSICYILDNQRWLENGHCLKILYKDAKFLSQDVENKYLYIYVFFFKWSILYFTCKPFTCFQLIFFFFFSLVFFSFFYSLLFFFFSFFLFSFFFSFFFFNFSCFFFAFSPLKDFLAWFLMTFFSCFPSLI